MAKQLVPSGNYVNYENTILASVMAVLSHWHNCNSNWLEETLLNESGKHVGLIMA